MNKVLKISLLLILICLFTGCTSDFEKDFPYMKNTDNVYVKVDYDEAMHILETNGILLLAFDSNKYECPYCKTVIPILNEVAISEEVEQIFYLDIYEMRSKKTKEYVDLMNYIDNQVDDLRNNKSGELALIVPDVYFIKDGQIVAHHIATVLVNDTFVYELSDIQTQELIEIYKRMFNLLK